MGILSQVKGHAIVEHIKEHAIIGVPDGGEITSEIGAALIAYNTAVIVPEIDAALIAYNTATIIPETAATVSGFNTAVIIPEIDQAISDYNSTTIIPEIDQAIEDFDLNFIQIDNSDSPYQVTSTDATIFVTTASGVVSIGISDAQCVAGRTLRIADNGGMASTNSITVSGNSTTFNGYDDIALIEDYASIEIKCDGTNWILI